MLRVSCYVVFCAAVALSAARNSPHADVVEELTKSFHTFDARISNNVLEDASLDVPELVRKYEYPLEVHNIQTEDGYILEVHRIPHGRDRNNVPSSDKPVVFLMHGLLSSSADYVLMGPGTGLGYILAEEGFDVWMGNARGNYYSRRHASLNPNGILDTRFWEFSWEQIGNIDLPTMIDLALKTSGKERLHYVGHSQGTTAFFVMGSLNSAYNNKITSMHALAPVAYMAYNQSPGLKLISQYAHNLEAIASLIGMGEFLPNNEFMTWAGQNLCMDEAIFQPLCSNILFIVGGWNQAQHNTTMLPVKLGHTPAGAAVRQFAHYGQSIAEKGFRRYDYGSVRNLLKYGRLTPPAFDLSRITAPVFLHYSEEDPLAHVNDVYRLFAELGRPIGLFKIPQKSFSHLDFMWGIDAKSLVYDRVINHIRAMENL